MFDTFSSIQQYSIQYLNKPLWKQNPLDILFFSICRYFLDAFRRLVLLVLPKFHMWIKCNICNAFSKLHANLWNGTNVIPSLEDSVQQFCVAAPCFSERTMIFSCVYDNCNTALSCVLCYFGSFIEKLLIKKGWGKTQDRIIVMMKKLGRKYLNFFMATVKVPHVNIVNHILVFLDAKHV